MEFFPLRSFACLAWVDDAAPMTGAPGGGGFLKRRRTVLDGTYGYFVGPQFYTPSNAAISLATGSGNLQGEDDGSLGQRHLVFSASAGAGQLASCVAYIQNHRCSSEAWVCCDKKPVPCMGGRDVKTETEFDIKETGRGCGNGRGRRGGKKAYLHQACVCVCFDKTGLMKELMMGGDGSWMRIGREV